MTDLQTKILNRSDLLPKVAVVVGTRPGIVKFAPVVKALESLGADYFMIHTGQHYSPNMDRAFFEALDLPTPTHTNPDVAECRFHGEQTAAMMVGVERALLEERPAVVVVGGDANTNLAGALAARKLANIKLAHMEAGLRSHDWSMPEEHNRVMIDHISDILYTPTEQCRDNLLADNVKGRITITGNTIVDAVEAHRELAASKSRILDELGLEPRSYVVLTVHREENVDNPDVLEGLIDSLRDVAPLLDREIIFPVHPRARLRFEAFGLTDRLEAIPGLRMMEPVDYLDMLNLVASAELVLTDSGGIQEESCILRVPCITLRENTERPETVTVGANVIVGRDPELLREAVGSALADDDRDWANPFGDGRTGHRIAEDLVREAEQCRST